MLTDLARKLLLLLLAVGGVLLIILIAPFLIAAAYLLFWGVISAVFLAFVGYCLWELWKGR